MDEQAPPKGAPVAAAAGSALQEMSGRSFTVRDPEGYLWSVGECNPCMAHEARSATTGNAG